MQKQQYYTPASAVLEQISPLANGGGLFGAMKSAEAWRKHIGECDVAQSPIWQRPSIRKMAKSPDSKQQLADLRHMAERHVLLVIAENLFFASRMIVRQSKNMFASSDAPRRRRSRRAAKPGMVAWANKPAKALTLTGSRRALSLTDEWSVWLANIRSGNDHMSVRIAAVSFVTGFLLACSAFLPVLSNHTLRQEVLQSWRTIGHSRDQYADALPEQSPKTKQSGKNAFGPVTRLSYKQKIDS